MQKTCFEHSEQISNIFECHVTPTFSGTPGILRVCLRACLRAEGMTPHRGNVLTVAVLFRRAQASTRIHGPGWLQG